MTQLGTTENYGNTEMRCSSNVVILPKCRGFCQNAVILHFLQECFVFNQHSWCLSGDFITKIFIFASATELSHVLLLFGSICDRDVIVKICILMLCSYKISQMKNFHCMQW